MKNNLAKFCPETSWVFDGNTDVMRYIRDCWKYNFLKTHTECMTREYFYINKGGSPSKEISDLLMKICDSSISNFDDRHQSDPAHPTYTLNKDMKMIKVDDEYSFSGWNDELYFHSSDRFVKHKFYVCTDEKTHEKIADLLKNEKKPSELTFHYKEGPSSRTREVTFTDVINVPSEHYPFLKMNVDNYIKKYLESSAALLFLQGPPGTGKTTFLKYILTSNHFNAITTYDQSIMEADKFYLDFMFDEEKNIMIVEDADALLSDRKKTTNKSVSKVLNFSDGLSPIKNKKIIFTTNLSSLDDVDPALLRPGRCFDIIKFRTLNLQEANAVCKVHKLPKLKEDRSYSLAEILNKKEDEHNQDNTKFGFF